MKTEGDHPGNSKGGLAPFFVEHREVGWVALIAVLVWGFTAFRQLPQQQRVWAAIENQPGTTGAAAAVVP